MAQRGWHCGCAWSEAGACPHVAAFFARQPVYDAAVAAPERTIGRRRELLERFFYEHCAKEIFAEALPHPAKGDYCTRYRCDYNIPDFVPSVYPTSENPELKIKFPLYTDIGKSFWQERSKRPSVSQFRRRSCFTTPLNEIMEENPFR